MSINGKNRKKGKSSKKITETTPAFLFGIHASLEAIEQGMAREIFLQEGLDSQKIREIKTLAEKKGLPIKEISKIELAKWTENATHQGVVVEILPYHYLTLSELLQKTEKENPFFLVLDSLEDPHNLGSILRTADAAGVDGVILPKHRAARITPTVMKTSTGAAFHVPIAQVTNLVQTVGELKEKGFWIFGTDMEGSDYRAWQTKGKLALIIGNEGRGIRSLLKKEVDEWLTIPMFGHVQSLNASVAAGILMYEVVRGRNSIS